MFQKTCEHIYLQSEGTTCELFFSNDFQLLGFELVVMIFDLWPLFLVSIKKQHSVSERDITFVLFWTWCNAEPSDYMKCYFGVCEHFPGNNELHQSGRSLLQLRIVGSGVRLLDVVNPEYDFLKHSWYFTDLWEYNIICYIVCVRVFVCVFLYLLLCEDHFKHRCTEWGHLTGPHSFNEQFEG